MASGVATSEVYQADHWDVERATDKANVVDLRWDDLIHPEKDPDGVLPVDKLRGQGLEGVNWKPQASGTSVRGEPAAALEQLWRQYRDRLRGETRPDEDADMVAAYPEGALRVVRVNSYERDSCNRRACIEHWGSRCVVCRLDFQEAYGPIGTGFIEVHHLTALSDVGRVHAVDPIQDMRPVCPNCHAIIHRGKPQYSPDEVRAMLQARNVAGS